MQRHWQHTVERIVVVLIIPAALVAAVAPLTASRILINVTMNIVQPVGGVENARENAESLDKLPSDVMVRLNEFLELPDRVRLASSNKTLQKLVFQECIPLWRDIDFSKMAGRNGLGRLTDDSLARLLIRVNARIVTRNLNLKYCKNVRGTGIAPLTCSPALETIDLRQLEYDRRSDEHLIVPILRTMIPFKLRRVRFHGYPLDEDVPSLFSDFLRDLHTFRQQQARDENITCTACDGKVAEESRQVIAGICGPPLSSCGTCHEQYCRRGSCTVNMKDCSYCGDTSCDACTQVKRCIECHESYCEPCNPVYSCAKCSIECCEVCDCHIDFLRFCGVCDMIICRPCNDQRNGLMACCDACYEYYCRECKKTYFCTGCHHNFCSGCADFTFFDCCNEILCEQCVIPYQCDECEKKYCGGSEAVERCDICKRNLCEFCAEVKQCDACSQKCCVFCREVNVLSGGGGMKCIRCVVPRECDGCSNQFLKQDVEQCGSCETILCEDCRSPSCCVCHKSFCNDDCTFVDSCERCESSYCGDCGIVVRCAWCGVSCCETCRLFGGCCRMCNEKPSKKARTSR